jgi:hypothetical protein
MLDRSLTVDAEVSLLMAIDDAIFMVSCEGEEEEERRGDFVSPNKDTDRYEALVLQVPLGKWNGPE